MSQELTESDLTALRWSVRCNEDGIGYLGPTVKRYGPLAELHGLVGSGLLRCEQGVPGIGRRNPDELGYWITKDGRRALRGHERSLTAKGRKMRCVGDLSEPHVPPPTIGRWQARRAATADARLGARR